MDTWFCFKTKIILQIMFCNLSFSFSIYLDYLSKSSMLVYYISMTDICMDVQYVTTTVDGNLGQFSMINHAVVSIPSYLLLYLARALGEETHRLGLTRSSCPPGLIHFASLNSMNVVSSSLGITSLLIFCKTYRFKSGISLFNFHFLTHE